MVEGATGPSREGQTIAGSSRVVRYANFVKLPHTLFALPFALVGVTLASFTTDVTARVAWWVVVAFTTARFAAMGFNRIVDREYDARNPRTAAREIPMGAMTVREASLAVVAAAAIFVVAARMLNTICFVLAPVALAWVFFYSYTKRFTRWSHLVLGAGLGIAPVGGYLAVTGSWSDPWWMLVALAAGVTCWTAGFDVIYAMQDVEVDRREGLHSLPSRMGPAAALRVARALHVATIVAFLFVGRAVHAGVYYHLGVALAAALLAYEHLLASEGRIQRAFFVVNLSLSAVFFVFVLLERILPWRAVWPG